MRKKVCNTHYCRSQKILDSENQISKDEVTAWGFLHICWYTSSCPYKDNCVQMELGLLTSEM